MPLSWSVVQETWSQAEYKVSGVVRMIGGHDDYENPYATCATVWIGLPGFPYLFINALWDDDYGGSGDPAICFFASLPDRDVWQIVGCSELSYAECSFEAKVTGALDLMGAVVENPQPLAMIGLHQCSGNGSAALTGDLDLYLRPEMASPTLTVTIGSMSHEVALDGPLYDATLFVAASIGKLYTGTIAIVDNEVTGLSSESYIGMGAIGTADVAIVTASYSRTQGVCSEERSMGRSIASPGYVWGSPSHHCRAVVGNGSVAYYGAYRGEGGALYGGTAPTGEAGHAFYDFAGSYTVPNDVRHANMDAAYSFATPPDSRRSSLSMISVERHPAESWDNISASGETFDHQHATYSLEGVSYLDPTQQSEDLVYNGHWWYQGDATKLGTWEEFFDLPVDLREENNLPETTDDENYFVQHFGIRIDNIESTWDPDSPLPETPPYGHYDEPAIQEPSHPAWTEDNIHWPDQLVDDDGNLVYDEETGEPVWDTGLYCRNKNPWHDDRVEAICLSWANALKLTLLAPGAKVDSLVPVDWLGDWTLTNCTEESGTYGIHWTPGSGQQLTAELPNSKIFVTGARLTGFRFLKVPWNTASATGEFTFSIGGHSWALNVADVPVWVTGHAYAVDDTVRKPGETFGLYHCITAHTAAGTWEDDLSNWEAGAMACLDLCRPDSSTVEPAPILGAINSERYTTNSQSDHPHTVDYEWDIVMPEGKDLVRFRIERFEPDGTYALEIFDDTDKVGEIDAFTNRYNQWWPSPQGYLATDWYEITSGTARLRLTAGAGFNWGIQFSAYEVADTSSAQLSTQQSIAPYEKPLDASVLDGGSNERAADDAEVFRWEFPSGWGVGRIDSVKVESGTADADFWMDTWQLYRKTAEEGGFARVLVMPHEPYNDWRSFVEDFCWQIAGETLNQGGGIQYWNYRRIVPKVLVIVDGVVALEIPAGYVEEDNTDESIGVGELEYSSPFYHRTRFALTGPAWLSGEEYSEGDYVVNDGVQYACILGHTASSGNEPPNATYWDLVDWVPPGYPKEDYTDDASAYAINGAVEIAVDPTGVNAFHWNHSWTTFLRDGVYEPDGSNEIVVPLDIQAWRLNVRPGAIGDLTYLVTGSQKLLRGCVAGLAFNGQDPAANVTVQLSAPNDDPDTPGEDSPTDYYATTNKLGWFVSPAIKTRFASVISGAGTPTPASLPVRSRLYSRMASLDIVPSGGHPAIDYEPACRIYRVCAASGSITIDHTDDGGQTWKPVPALAVATGESPVVSASWRNYQNLVVVYVNAGALMKRMSTNEGDTWGEAMELCDGTHPYIYRDPATGHKLLFYYLSGSIYVRRTPDEFVNWMKADGTLVAVDPEPTPADVAFEVADDAADDTPAVIHSGLPDHKVMLIYQKGDGTLGCVFSQANGMPPYA